LSWSRRGTGEPFTISPEELKAKLDRGDAVVLVDVREPDEWAVNRIEGATLIPLMALPARARELDPKAEVVAYCKMGSRSEQAVLYLRRLGFLRAKNLEGGIDAWIQRVDPSLPSY
jgi:adenylyltransferase/sulfurtransferase